MKPARGPEKPPPLASYSVREVLQRAEQHPDHGSGLDQSRDGPGHAGSDWLPGRESPPTIGRMLRSNSVLIIGSGLLGVSVVAIVGLATGFLPGPYPVSSGPSANGLAASMASPPEPRKPASSLPSDLLPSRMPELAPQAARTPNERSSTARTSNLSVRLETSNNQLTAGRGETAWPITVAGDTGSLAGSKIRIFGLPAGVRLSSGAAAPDGSWIMDVDAGRELKLTPPPAAANATLKIMIAAADGKELASVDKVFKISPPTELVPEPSTAAAKNYSEDKARDLRLQGEAQLAVGDVSGARMFFKRAADGGDAQAAVSMGATYDPKLFETLKVQGMVPDRELARKWYQRAVDLGSKDAFERIQALK